MAAEVTALVTGAGSGIGRCFAETLARAGVDLILLDIDTNGLAKAAGAAQTPGRRVEAATVDVAISEDVQTAISEFTEPDGRLDLVINCAAILGGGRWEEQSGEDLERVMWVNFLGTVNVMRAALPALCRAEGHIVNFASTAAVHGWPGLSAYSAAKFAIAGFSEGVRAELQERRVGLTVVFPLLIDTPLVNSPDVPPILQTGRRIQPGAVVRKTLRAVARKKPRVYVPGSVRLIAALQGTFPGVLDWYGTRLGMIRRAD